MTERIHETTANDRFKRSQSQWMRASFVLAVAVHLAAFTLVRFDVNELAAAEEDPLVFVIPIEADLPEPPADIVRPALPRISDVAVDEAPRFATWEEIPELPVTAPPAIRSQTGPRFIAYDTPPELLNGEDVGRALEREYPRALRRANIEGRVELWLYLTVEGAVERSQVKTSSGNADLDRAALAVAATMRFSPALSRDRPTAVWVQQWITFVVR